MKHEPIDRFEISEQSTLVARLEAGGIKCLDEKIADAHKAWELEKARRGWLRILWQDEQYRAISLVFAILSMAPIFAMTELRPAIGCSLGILAIYALVTCSQYWNMTTWQRVGLERRADGAYCFEQNNRKQTLPAAGTLILDNIRALDPTLRPVVDRLGEDPLVRVIDDLTREEATVFVYDDKNTYWPV